jgi:two-component system, sensor histidine kinase RegB
MTQGSETPRVRQRPGTDVSVSLRMLVLIRWVVVAGQAATILLVHYGLGFVLPIKGALAVVSTSAALNIAASWPRRASPRLGDREASVYLAYDMLQLGTLLFLTGGLQNPFAMLMLAPVTVAATILSRRSVFWLSALTVAAITVIAVFHLPLPWRDAPLPPPPLYVFGVWTALVLSTVFIAGYTWNVAQEARRMRDAFTATQLALAREQRVSAVGGIAAAAAHQLGSPLATIAVVAKELVRDLPADSPYAEDALLLLSQSERCRTILADLAQQRDAESGSPFTTRLPFSALVEAAGEPYREAGKTVTYTTAAGRDAEAQPVEEPLVARSPEIMHGLGNLIQNAAQFAVRAVDVTISWSEDTAAVDIVDDGLGFPQAVLARIGEPYISGRAGAAEHMGLGIFIAESLLERTGGHLSFANLPDGGAQVVVEWRRAQLEGMDVKVPLKEAGE